MRTTIEIPDAIRQKLAAEAMSRNMKGYSQIIMEALYEHFRTGTDKKKQLVKSLKGCLNMKEYQAEVERLREGRENWRE